MPSEVELLNPEYNEVTLVGASLSLPKSSQILAHGMVWAVEPSFQATAMEVLSGLSVAEAMRMQAEFLATEAKLENAAAEKRMANNEPAPKPYEMVGSLALIPVTGVMTKKPNSASAFFGGTSTLQTIQKLRAAREDPSVEKIFSRFETPGGEAAGCAELADEFRKTNAVKPIIGFIDDQCASAGMFPASQCSALYMNRMGRCGCVSTLWVVTDTSSQAAMMGVKVTAYVSEGATYKGMLTSGTSMTPAQEKHIQEIVDHYGADFKATVQMGRGLSDEQMAQIVTAKMFDADEALTLGLIDGICSYNDCLNAILAGEDPLSSTTSNQDHDAAKASSAANGDTMLTIKEALAFLRGQTLDALKAEGIDLAKLDATAPIPPPVAPVTPPVVAPVALDPAVQEQINLIAVSQATNAANTFADELIRNSKAAPVEKEKIVTAYVQALSADGGGKPRFDGAVLMEGPNVSSLKAAYASRPAHPFLTQMVGEVDTSKKIVLSSNGGKSEEISIARLRELASYTEAGRNGFKAAMEKMEGR